LVERSVRDREVVGSNPAIPTTRERTAGPATSPGLPCLHSRPEPYVIEAFLHWLGFGLCHQLPARSFVAGGYQLPVCARDTGIYLGFVLSLLVMAALDRGRRRSELPHPAVLAIGGAFVALMAWDGVTSYAGLRATTNDLRLITGLLAGWALPLAVSPLVNSSLWANNSPERVLGKAWEVAVWALAAPVSFAVIRWGLPYLGVAYALAVAAAIVVTFVAVNLIIVLLAPRFERRASRLRDAWLPLLIALAISAAEVGAAAALRVWLQSLTRVG
jgi:uncharacterized membrane protein